MGWELLNVPSICSNLTREYALASSQQQQTITENLGVIQNESAEAKGICTSILQYLTSRIRGSGDHSETVRGLRSNLVQSIYDSQANFNPVDIKLSNSHRRELHSMLLAGLEYDDMVDRESRIATAHKSTLRWALGDNEYLPDRPKTIRSSSLREWLECDEQLFWITGKAGSGKSTLMKHLCNPGSQAVYKTTSDADSLGDASPREYSQTTDRTRCHPFLRKWAGASTLIVASFYFWNSGNQLQMSQDGLLSTLLYQIIVQCPEMAPVLAPQQWESLCLFNYHHRHWSAKDLRDALFRAVRSLGTDKKMCLFIDGLDEFDGDHEGLISLVQQLICESKAVKICVASRPWNVFQDAFDRKPNLRLEDLTFDDIKCFVESKFQSNSDFDNLRWRYPGFADQLMNNIVVKASGVFLWVDLVVASLLSGMRLGDRIEDFQRRLDELPPDLENLYEKILHSLDKFYLGHAAQYFALVETTETPITILQLYFADEESPESAINMAVGSIPKDFVDLHVEAVSRRLNSRCKGFLEAERGLQRLGQQEYLARRASQLTVQYLHRTVRDFIKSPKAQTFLQSYTKPDFDPSLRLCFSYLMDLKNWNPTQQYTQDTHLLDREDELAPTASQAINCLRHAAKTQTDHSRIVVELLGELKRILDMPEYRQQINPSFPEAFNGDTSSQLDLNKPFLYIACSYGIVPYVTARAEKGCLIRQHTLESSLQVWPLLSASVSHDIPQPELVKHLLDLGADPNYRVSKGDTNTPWMLALHNMTLLRRKREEFASPEDYLAAEEKWKMTLRLMCAKSPPQIKSTDSLLNVISPAARQTLDELRKEDEARGKVWVGQDSWAFYWKFW